MEINSYLVQEGEFKDIKLDDITGLDSLIDFSYMGAAEFEGIVTPDGLKNPLNLSLKRIVKDKDNFIFIDTKIKDKQNRILYCFAKIDEKFSKDDYIKNVKSLTKRTCYLKASIHLPRFIEEEKNEQDLFWWDIKNDFFLFFGEENRNKITKALDELKIKWIPKKKEQKGFFSKLFKRL